MAGERNGHPGSATNGWLEQGRTRICLWSNCPLSLLIVAEMGRAGITKAERQINWDPAAGQRRTEWPLRNSAELAGRAKVDLVL
jgi:hypothetical protein